MLEQESRLVPYAFWIFRLLAFAVLMPGHWLLLALLWAGGDCWRHWLPPEGKALQDDGLQALLQRCGLSGVTLRLSDVKAKGKANAGFSGPPWRRQIVLSPTLLRELTAELQEAVLAHEAGHCRLRHEEQWLLGGGLFWLALFSLMAWSWNLWSVVGLALAAWLLIEASRPLTAALRRHWEFEADAFAAAQVGAEAMAAALVRLDGLNGPPMSSPYHPSLEDRLRRLRLL